MRSTYPLKTFVFKNPGLQPVPMGGPPQRIVLHTDGNPNPHTALGSLQWGDSTGAFSINDYVDADGTVYACVPPDQQAYHVKEHRVAEAEGWPVAWGNGKRGDLGAIGIETVQDASGHWSQETRISLLLRVVDHCRRWPHLARRITEHAYWDPWQRAGDVGDALYVPDFVLDVQDVLAGREPWRTVGPTANGEPAAAPQRSATPEEDPVKIAELQAQVEKLSAENDRLKQANYLQAVQIRLAKASAALIGGNPTGEDIHAVDQLLTKLKGGK